MEEDNAYPDPVTSLDGTIKTETFEESPESQMILFRFPQQFDTKAFAALNLSIPKVPLPSTGVVARFCLGQVYYLMFEEGVDEIGYRDALSSLIVTKADKQLRTGKPFYRFFYVQQDLMTAPAPEDPSRLGELLTPPALAPETLDQMRRSIEQHRQPFTQPRDLIATKFLPIGYVPPGRSLAPPVTPSDVGKKRKKKDGKPVAPVKSEPMETKAPKKLKSEVKGEGKAEASAAVTPKVKGESKKGAATPSIKSEQPAAAAARVPVTPAGKPPKSAKKLKAEQP